MVNMSGFSTAATAAACGACALAASSSSNTETLVVAAAAAALSLASTVVDRDLFSSLSASSSDRFTAVSTSVIAAASLWYLARGAAAATGHDSVVGFVLAGDYDATGAALVFAAVARAVLAVAHACGQAPQQHAAVHPAFLCPASAPYYQQGYKFAPNHSHAVRAAPVAMAGYVPDGLSEDAYKKQKAKDAAKKDKNYSTWLNKKKKGFEDLTEWQKKRDAKYEKQGRGLGHEMVKSKYKGPKEEEKARGWFGERILTREYKEGKGNGKGKK